MKVVLLVFILASSTGPGAFANSVTAAEKEVKSLLKILNSKLAKVDQNLSEAMKFEFRTLRLDACQKAKIKLDKAVKLHKEDVVDMPHKEKYADAYLKYFVQFQKLQKKIEKTQAKLEKCLN